MRSVCVEYFPGPSENQMPPYIAQDDLFGILEVELSPNNLIRISLLMWWNMEVQYTSNYSLG